jgi:hypothetical protein
MALTFDKLPEGLQQFVDERSKHYGAIDFASPLACAFALEVWHAAIRYQAQLDADHAARGLPVPEREPRPARELIEITGDYGSFTAMVCTGCGTWTCCGACMMDWGPGGMSG